MLFGTTGRTVITVMSALIVVLLVVAAVAVSVYFTKAEEHDMIDFEKVKAEQEADLEGWGNQAVVKTLKTWRIPTWVWIVLVIYAAVVGYVLYYIILGKRP